MSQINAAIARLQAHSVEFLTGPTRVEVRPGTFLSFCRDPEGNVLELEFDDGSKVIVNRHVPNSEMWLAGKSGGFHFRHDAGGNWLDTRDGGEFFARLAAMITWCTSSRVSSG